MEKGWLSGISIPLYLLVIVFNLVSWIDINALWTEMPLLVNRLPERWELPAYFTLIINGGKLVLIVYVIYKKIMKHKTQRISVCVYHYRCRGKWFLCHSVRLGQNNCHSREGS